MRISDWSSDVCSSDLKNRVLRCKQASRNAYESGAQAKCDDVHILDVHAHQQGCVAMLGDGAQRTAKIGAMHEEMQQYRQANSHHKGNDLARNHGEVEIGRASWRERVCQYV